MAADSGLERGASRIDLAEIADFDLGELRVCPARRQVEFHGQQRELEPRVAQVLVALALARPHVVSRDRLIEQCWDGRIVGDDSINRCIVALRHLAKEFAPEPFAIETVPRVGYCLVERPHSAIPRNWAQQHWKASVAALVMLILVGAAALLAGPRVGRAESAPASIAVLSFRNLSSGEPYFAQGIGEEIIGQLARDPQFRVAGGASSGEYSRSADLREVARRLDVDYLLDGSVRTQGDRVRVNAGLVRASDGVRLWSDSYDGKLDDIFAIQQQIGGAIAGALRRKLARATRLSGPLVTNGETYNLYLTARGLLRTRQRRVGETAAGLLRDAIALDPGYAPAWAALASAVQMEAATKDFDTYAAANRLALGYARHAVRLAPDLAEAHQMLGEVLPYGTPASVTHLRRAAELSPNSAEILVSLGSAQSAVGDFNGELATYRRSHEVDPLWFRTVGSVSMAMADMGKRAEAEANARRGFAKNPVLQHILVGRIAWIYGDYSEAIRHWTVVAKGKSPRWRDTAKRTINDAKYALGLKTEPLVLVPRGTSARSSWRVWMDQAPPAPVWLARNRDEIVADVYSDENHVAAKLMLGAGRASELVTTYRSPVGLLGIRQREALRVDQLYETPIVALALRNGGQAAEADRLLRDANTLMRAVYRRSAVPFWFDADVAAIFAVSGKKEQALTMLERAMRRGWSHSGSTDLPEIMDEPAFQSLHGHPRFTAIRTKIAEQLSRERSEAVQLRL